MKRTKIALSHRYGKLFHPKAYGGTEAVVDLLARELAKKRSQ